MRTFRQRLCAAVLHRYPFLSGVGRVANSALIRGFAGEMQGTGWAKTASGEFVLTPLDDHVGRSIYFVGDIDPRISRLCRMLLRPGDVALDIGANIGIITMLMARLVGRTGSIQAFEPNPTAADLLLASLERNAITNVDLHRVALGATEDMLPLVVPRGNIGSASLLHRPDVGESVQVRVRSLSDVLASRELAAIRLVKLDVEGYERDVLRGARPLFERVPPDAIITECWGLETMQGEALVRELRALGYDVFVIARTLIRLRLVPFGQRAKGTELAHDALAIRPKAITSAIASCIPSR